MSVRLVVLLALVLGSSCRDVPRVAKNPLSPPPKERELLVREAQLEGGAIVARLEIPLVPSGPKPAILANLNEATTMANTGIVVVTYSINWALLKGGPPPPGPASENTVGKWVLAAPSRGSLGEQYLRQIVATATIVVPKVIDYLETVPEVDATRLAITGASTNGFLALHAVAADARLRAATVVAACGDFERFLRYSSMGMEGKPLALAPAYAQWLRSQEIVTDPGRVVHAALLMVNRVEDPLIPIRCADETHRALESAYAAAGRPGHYRYVRLEGEEGHGVGPREKAEHLAWMQTWLLSGR